MAKKKIKWEYCTLLLIPIPSDYCTSDSDYLDRINDLGQDGWEHYETIKGNYLHKGNITGQQYIYYFKRMM